VIPVFDQRALASVLQNHAERHDTNAHEHFTDFVQDGVECGHFFWLSLPLPRRDNAEMPLDPATLQIRPLTPADAPAAAELSTQLGYPATPEDLRPRIEALSATPDHIVLAAVLNGRLIGWIDASIERHLQDPDIVNLGGLVVDDSSRGSGVGKRLCEAVEDWARTRNIPIVRVRSQVKRADAHRFYLRDGYRHVKTSLVFEKSVL